MTSDRITQLEEQISMLDGCLMGFLKQEASTDDVKEKVRCRMIGNFLSEIIDFNEAALSDPQAILSGDEFVNYTSAYNYAIRLFTEQNFYKQAVKQLLDTQLSSLSEADKDAKNELINFYNLYYAPIYDTEPIHSFNDYTPDAICDFETEVHHQLEQDDVLRAYFQNEHQSPYSYFYEMNMRLLNVLPPSMTVDTNKRS